MDIEGLKQKAAEEVDALMPLLKDVSRFIYDNPELAFEEIKASAKLADILEENGFTVEKNAGGLETAFTATYLNDVEKEEKHVCIGITAEYDALAELGHACGHNLIASSSLGAALALKKVMEEENLKGEIRLVGTPAEEDGGGKIILIDKGVFEGVSVCMMMHPTSAVTRIAGNCLSSHGMKIRWKGRSAHAESHPEDGINALDALHIYYTAVSCMRQQLPDDVRIAQVVTEGGCEGMIPDSASMSVDIVSEDKNLASTVEKVRKCAEGAAIASGCSYEIEDITGYLGRKPNTALEKVFRNNFGIIGEPLMDGMPEDYGTTDFGNVMREVPSCNPYVSLLPEKKISGHTQQFKELAISERSEYVIEISAKVMVYSSLDILTDENILKEAWEEFYAN